MANRGAPTKYHDRFCKPARALCERGATDQELAEYFEINVSTIHDWRAKHVSFANATKQGKEYFDSKVERALYERATGYSHPDVHISNWKGEITVTPITKHYPPSEVAAIFWLKNRKPKEWRDKQDVALTDGNGNALKSQVLIVLAQQMALNPQPEKLVDCSVNNLPEPQPVVVESPKNETTADLNPNSEKPQ